MIVTCNRALIRITTRTYIRKAKIVMTIALKNPTLWLALIITHIKINVSNHASHPPKNRKTKAYVKVIKNAVRKTRPKSVFLALLKKPKAIFKKIAIIKRTIR